VTLEIAGGCVGHPGGPHAGEGGGRIGGARVKVEEQACKVGASVKGGTGVKKKKSPKKWDELEKCWGILGAVLSRSPET